jgi:hypothetical protein
VTLTDFGVARAAQETRLTTTGALVGTPQYMSPEQAQGNDVDHRTDIYSLAVVAYQMLAGRMPFDAATPHAVLHQVIYDPPPALHPQRPDLPAELEGILAKALAKDPAGRYNSASAFVEALEGLGARGARQAVPSAPGRPPAKAAPVAAGRVLQPRAPVRATAGAQPAVGPRFGLAWFLASTLAWAIGWALGIPLADATGRLIGPTGSITLVEVTSGLAYWLVLGLAVGTAQWLLLRRHMSGMWEWIVATAAGLGVVGSLKWTQAILIDPIMNNVFRWLEGMGWERVGFVAGMLMAMITEGLGGLLVGLAQWVTLQNRVPRHGRWLLVSTGAWAASGLVVSLLMMSLQLPDGDPATMWVPPLLAGVVVSAVTAAGAVRLLAGTAKEQHATI